MPRQPRPDSRRRAPAARTRAAQPPQEALTGRLPSSGLTTRAAVLGLVLCGLVVTAALPLRELLDQRNQIAEVRQQQAAQQARVDELTTLRAQLDDPNFIKSLASERLHFIVPGERQYIYIKAPVAAPAPVQGTAAQPVGEDAPWYSQLYGTVQNADKPPR